MGKENKTHRILNPASAMRALAASFAVGASVYAYNQGASSTHETGVNFETVCVDPQGDEHPTTVDILQVREGETTTVRIFEFTMLSDVRSENSILGPDIGLGGGFLDQNNLSQVLFHASGAEQTSDIRVRIISLRDTIDIRQGPAIPIREDEIL